MFFSKSDEAAIMGAPTHTEAELNDIMEGPSDLNKPNPWLVKLHKYSLMLRFHHRDHQNGNNESDGFFINLRDLQRMRLRKLQAKLIRDVVDLRFDNQTLTPAWDRDLRRYGEFLTPFPANDGGFNVKLSGSTSPTGLRIYGESQRGTKRSV